MRRMRTLLPWSMVSMMFLCWATAARADVIRVTSGNVGSLAGEPFGGFFGEPWFGESFEVFGPGFSLKSGLLEPNGFVELAVRPVVAQGALLDLSGVLHVPGTVGAWLNGSFGVIASPFTMSFDASPTHVECRGSSGVTACSGSAPFTLSADLAFTPFGTTDPLMLHLIGGGTANAHIVSSAGGEGGAVEYVFGASPTPEPATLSLLAAGALMAAGRWRRQRARRQQC